MDVAINDFFKHRDDFFQYRQHIYEISPQTAKSNQVDLRLFENFIRSQKSKVITGPTVIDFQYYLKDERQNCGASINRKIHTLRSFGNFLRLYGIPDADQLPFYDVMKIRTGYRNRPGALTPQQVQIFISAIDALTILGIRDYAVYAMMYQLGLRVGEIHDLSLSVRPGF